MELKVVQYQIVPLEYWLEDGCLVTKTAHHLLFIFFVFSAWIILQVRLITNMFLFFFFNYLIFLLIFLLTFILCWLFFFCIFFVFILSKRRLNSSLVFLLPYQALHSSNHQLQHSILLFLFIQKKISNDKYWW